MNLPRENGVLDLVCRNRREEPAYRGVLRALGLVSQCDRSERFVHATFDGIVDRGFLEASGDEGYAWHTRRRAAELTKKYAREVRVTALIALCQTNAT